MQQLRRFTRAVLLGPVLAVLSASVLAAPAPRAPIELFVDLSEAPRRIFHAREELAVEPGPLVLLYPKWLPGEHGPTGPIGDLAGLVVSANGRPIPWNRDARDLFVFHVDVPAGTTRLTLELDYLSPRATGQFGNGPASSDRVAVMSWNTLLLYPAGRSIHELTYRPALRLPAGWSFGTALREARREGRRIEFEPVSLAELVDSPVAAGAHHRQLDLTGSAAVPHRLHLVGDSEAALALRPETVAGFRKLVAEALALFGSYHYRSYDFLVTLSDHVQSFGLEHHESSDDRLPERALVDDAPLRARAGLLPHEMVHSWNGKHRRPAGLTRDDFQEPFEDDLLWVYEGLTSYLDEILTVRSGLWEPDYGRDSLAFLAAGLVHRAGREWRPLADTARAAHVLYGVPDEWEAWRRGVDFYDEGVLIWLEADTRIRSLSGGRKSLDDFCRAFHGGASGRPVVRPFTYDELTQALAGVAGGSWREFFDERVYAVRPQAPLGGIESAGWRLVYTDEPNLHQASREKASETLDLRFSLGLLLNVKQGEERGRILDVLPGSPAANPELAPGSMLIAVNGRRWSEEILSAAIAEARESTEPIRLLVANADFFHDVAVDYHGGNRFPHLERIEGREDVLSRIQAPRTD